MIRNTYGEIKGGNMVNSKIVQEDDKEFQIVLKELGLENKQLTEQDLTRVYGYMQEIYCLG
jgi:hypothetical protein